MGERKLISAFITSLAAFFILPFLYLNGDEQFIETALRISVYAFPIIFTYGLIISYVSEKIANTKLNSTGVSFILHTAFGSLFAVPVFIVENLRSPGFAELQIEFVMAGFTLGAIFFFVDLILIRFGKYLQLKSTN
ncbi:hypothetical protein KZO01_10290 [Kurthia zopfii]|uniref:Uncharacterized protein n=1 Tax=Kurthia zopfii TaxID=1650 RepID=A0A2U3AFV0_9BACL|nr:hypothetical protein [Kurthia zopfii]PWI23432.1 hypothetical protein DF281_02510 [Kurthia zopfii]TDR39832.1 hypothetical protein DFR61_11049 [Kurthia zopfii]STX09281.1 Uncharacterised protein [Kurthia zopfii]VEI06217.1 Uncharacterised protein [Kurthia zopfii]GEK30720.1 hypothetical protein KZO01_10290 [Kurthia zopfii]